MRVIELYNWDEKKVDAYVNQYFDNIKQKLLLILRWISSTWWE